MTKVYNGIILFHSRTAKQKKGGEEGMKLSIVVGCVIGSVIGWRFDDIIRRIKRKRRIKAAPSEQEVHSSDETTGDF